MTQRMRTLQQAFEVNLSENHAQIRLVSVTVDPAYDSPPILKEYAALWGADLSTWYFLTGPPDETLSVIREGFKISASQEGSSTDDMPSMVHSTNFLLIDGTGFVRAIYHMDMESFTEVILSDVKLLLDEL